MDNWTIHVVQDTPEVGLYNIHTHGLSNYHLTDLMTVSDKPDIAVYMIRATANAMIRGDEFNPNVLHYIDTEDGDPILTFNIQGLKKNFDESNMCLDLKWYSPDFQFPEVKRKTA